MVPGRAMVCSCLATHLPGGLCVAAVKHGRHLPIPRPVLKPAVHACPAPTVSAHSPPGSCFCLAGRGPCMTSTVMKSPSS